MRWSVSHLPHVTLHILNDEQTHASTHTRTHVKYGMYHSYRICSRVRSCFSFPQCKNSHLYLRPISHHAALKPVPIPSSSSFQKSYKNLRCSFWMLSMHWIYLPLTIGSARFCHPTPRIYAMCVSSQMFRRFSVFITVRFPACLWT